MLQFDLIEIEIKWQRFFILFFLIQSPIKSDDNKMTHHFVTKATLDGKKRWHFSILPYAEISLDFFFLRLKDATATQKN
jgi:hypothetical protein